MAGVDASAMWELVSSLQGLNGDGSGGSTEQATCTRVDNDGTVWVRLLGAETDTPVNGQRLADVVIGDNVTVTIEDGLLSVIGNSSRPSTSASHVEEVVGPVVQRVTEVVNVVADKASIGELQAATARIGELEADHVSVADFQAEQANIDTLQANTADIDTIRANSAKVQNLTAAQLEADHATIGSLDANYARANLANVDNAWIENGTVKDGAITNAMINSVSANKLTAGTIDASNINVTNLNADNITTGTINGQRIGEGSLSLSKLDESVYTEAEVNNIVDGLNDRIDGAIETFTGTVVPTLNNSPASGWNTTKLRDEHVGDVYYVVNSQSQQNGYCYRFTKSGNTYSWQLIKDSDVTAALQRISAAEGKITTFDSDISTLKTDTGTLTTRTTNLETRADDVDATLLDKVDVTTFNEVSDTVDSHTQTISQHTTAISNKADSSTVTAVTNRVSKNEQDISGINTTIGELQDTVETKADGSTVSTISNKLNTVSDTVDGHTQTLTSVQNTLSTKADSSTVSTLTTQVNTIEDTVDGHTQTIEGQSTVLTNNGLTSSTNITSRVSSVEQDLSGYKTTVSETYATKTAVNGKADASDVTALAGRVTTAETAINQNAEDITLRATKAEFNALSIGGRNLFTWPLSGTKWKDEEHALDPYRNRGSYTPFIGSLLFDPSETVGEQYTISFWAKSPNGATALKIYNRNGKPKYFRFAEKTLATALGNEWEFFSLTVTNAEYSGADTPSTNETYWRRIEIYAPDATGVLVKQIKVEKGNKATDWTPAPEDMATAAELKVANDNIELKVSKDGVISSINQSAETVKIQASKVDITGDVVFSAINNDTGTTKISGGKIDATSITIGPSQVTGLTTALDGKADTSDIPTNVSDLTNDSGFQTSSQVESAITGKGYQTSSQVESAITSKGYATTSQAQGYATTAQQNAEKTATNYIVADSSGIKIADANPSTATTYLHLASSFLDFIRGGASMLKAWLDGSVAKVRVGAESGFNTLTDNEGIKLRSGTTVLGQFATNLIELGKNSMSAVIKLCGGVGKIEYDPTYNNGTLFISNSGGTSQGTTIFAGDGSTYAHVAVQKSMASMAGSELLFQGDYVTLIDLGNTISEYQMPVADVLAVLTSVPVTLYDNANAAASATATLSETAANFKRLTIFFKDGDGDYSSVEVWSPNGKRVALSLTWISGNSSGSQIMYQRVRWVTISGTTISTYRASTSERYRTGQAQVGGTDGVTNGDYISIVHVIGYR